MSTRISGLLLSVRNCHASVKMATEPTHSQWSEEMPSLATFRRRYLLALSMGVRGLEGRPEVANIDTMHLFYSRSQTVLYSLC